MGAYHAITIRVIYLHKFGIVVHNITQNKDVCEKMRQIVYC